MTLLLLKIFFCVASCYPDSTVVKAIENALINESLGALQDALYPPTDIQPNSVLLDFGQCITVQNILHQTNEKPAFVDCSQPQLCCPNSGYCYNFTNDFCSSLQYELSVEGEKLNIKLMRFVTSQFFEANMIMFDKLSFKLFTNLTFIQRHSDSQHASLHMAIDTLETMPSKDDFKEALELVISWVSVRAGS